MGIALADHLASLDEPSLTALLRRRPDACAAPVPRDLSRLAGRLVGRASLSAALRHLDRDTVEVGRATAVLGEHATPNAIAALLDADPGLVERSLGILTDLGLAWPDGATLRLPEALSEHWRAEVGADEPIARMARHVVADEMRRIAVAQGIPLSTRKAEVTQAIHDAWAEPGYLRDLLGTLPTSAQRRLGTLCRHEFDGLRPSADDHLLLDAGLLVLEGHVARIPREVAVAAWAAEARLQGVPELPTPADDPDQVASGAVAAAQSLLDTVTTVLDDAAERPIAALKSGGIGKRERARLVKRLDLDDDHLACLVIDLAAHAGLLGPTDAGYAPTAAYAVWREEDAAPRWMRLARTWSGLEYAPGRREVDGKEVAPPEPLLSSAGDLRRTLLSAAGGRSVRATADHLAWFCPAHGLDDAGLADIVAVTRREAELLGAVVGDAVSPLGRALADGDDVAAGAHLVDAPCEVVLQSDLTAMVSGRPGVAVSGLLADAATPESRGAATTYRFSPDSVRAALDAGWTADALLADLRALSDRPLPQPLEYLVTDVARRHGHVRVRPAGACLVTDEALSEEVLRARALRGLGLSRLAPTVLVSAAGPDAVLRALRGAGYFPVREDESGALVVERREAQVADTPAAPGAREAMTPGALAAQLVAAGLGRDLDDSPTAALLGSLNRRLGPDELDLLADALDHRHDVHLTYSDRNGTISRRVVTPEQVMHRWLVAWCHLRNDEREFTVENILEVSPAT
ncbi:helicase-associated domain-containing protein [Actinomycetospora lutea]|uniref:helicase-associated domain-containing protein n=1 Tax=Actinomycetospora lutea TaxID=663604 RepID=UPI0023658C80|nr:helicase-associated domain-containing protein [Actinomycetospora lutea]MDD7941971.1 helicase-associated domain-containing protein [Actinomycetospora lutea]